MADPARQPVVRTPAKVRHLTAEELGYDFTPAEPLPPDEEVAEPPALELEQLDEDDPVLETVRDLLTTYGGVIFTGPPGTSKSWYAGRVGATLVDGDPSRLRLVQFHPSYQYEDFMEGYVPNDVGDCFTLIDKHFVDLADKAGKRRDEWFVLVIDELSRGDPGRVFGEALTYIEKTKRDIPFKLASGNECTVPPNLVILATMNPLDRGVDEVDAALERRFAKYAMEPDANILASLLAAAGMDDVVQARVLAFFTWANRTAQTNPHAALGHTYFTGVGDVRSLRRLWEHQLRFHFDKAYRLDREGRREVYHRWDRVLGVTPAGATAEPDVEAEEEP